MAQDHSADVEDDLVPPEERGREMTDAPRTQGLYILSIPGNYWKVGVAFDVFDRVKQLQCGCPETIQVWAFWDTQHDGIPAFDMERNLHWRLASYRTCGEWFNAPANILSSYVKETWAELAYPKIYERLQRMRASKRASYSRKEASA